MLEELQKDFEAASKAYCGANGIVRDRDWFILKLQEEVGELAQAWNRVTRRARLKDLTPQQLRDDLADEAADVLGQVFLLAEAEGLDLRAAIQRKWRFTVRDDRPPVAQSTEVA